MNRIDKALADLRAEGKKILSPYLTAGDPSLDVTLDLMHSLVESGADIIEIGIPFSDPMAEGPVIQEAMERALANKVTCDDVLLLIEKFRKKNQETPIVLMGYLNPIEQYGYSAFSEAAHRAGVDGIIIVDLPPEESEAIVPLFNQQAIHCIYLCSPTTTEERMKMINHYGSGYLYYVSLKGVTGAGTLDVDAVKTNYGLRKKQSKLPIVVGFGIKNAKTAAAIATFSDGVVIGAELIRTIVQAAQNKEDIHLAAKKLIMSLREGIDQAVCAN